MKKMNKILALLTAGALMFGCMFTLTGCADGNTPANPGNTEQPENPEDKENPENPDAPEIPDNPEAPENPEIPDNPENPEKPTESKETIPDDFVKVNGATVSKAVSGSSIFTGETSYTIPTMYVCNHEVTQKEYETYCYYSSHKSGQKPSEESGLGDNFPAYYVSWNDAIVYCNLRSVAENLTPVYSIWNNTDVSKWQYTKSFAYEGKYAGNPYEAKSYDGWDTVTANPEANGYRLPTMAEWEYIARGGNNGIPENQTKYSGSDKYKEVAWCMGTTYPDEYKTHQIKTKAPNALGIYDMSGNVSEWCFDWQTVNYFRSNRGGNWFWDDAQCTVSYIKGYGVPQAHSDTIGFRVVRNAD